MSKRPPLKALWFGLIGLAMFSSTALSVHFAMAEPTLAAAKIAAAWRPKTVEEPVAMIFTGDIMLGRYIDTLHDRAKAADPDSQFPFTYMPEIREEAAAVLGVDELDLVVGNLEGPISDSTYRNPGTAMRFNFTPDKLQLLKDAGFTTLSQANNHTLDQGEEFLTQSYNYLAEAELDPFGHPSSPSHNLSFRRYQFTSYSVGLLGLNHTLQDRLDIGEVTSLINDYHDDVDALIVYVHWGPEYLKEAPEFIVEMAHKMIDAGASSVIGHHPHVVQNSEIYNGAPIYYSLGNFVFDQYFSSETQKGLVLAMRLDENGLSTVELPVELVNLGEPKIQSEY